MVGTMILRSWTAIVVLLSLGLATRCLAQQPPPYDGIQAGYDAYKLAEEKRQVAVQQQIYLNERNRAWTTPLATYGFGYGPYVSTFGFVPASHEYAYAYGNSPSYGGYVAGRPLTVFEPWPYVPGDIWGDFYTPRIRQPVAQVQTQTGPNRWESHPVYDPPLVSSPVLPPVNSPALDKTPYASERPASPPAPASAPPAVKRAPAPEAPSPGPSPEEEPARPRRRIF